MGFDSLVQYLLPIDLTPLPARFITVPQERLPRGASPPLARSAPGPGEPAKPAAAPRLPVVALGGTFDHLHAGHKILLSMAAWIASTKLIVGITGPLMLHIFVL